MHKLKPLSKTPLKPDFWLSGAVHSLITSGGTRMICTVMKEGGGIYARVRMHGGGWGMQLGDGMCE